MLGDDQIQAEIELLDRAMEGVKIVVCDACDPNGKITGVSPPINCARCGGTKMTTACVADDA